MNTGSTVRICCIIPSLQAGGMERVMSELINGFIRNHHAEVHVILYGNGREVFYEIDPSAIVHKPEFDFDNGHRFLSTIRTLAYLRKEISRISPTSVLSFGNLWNTFVLLSCVGKTTPIFISDRGKPTFKAGRFQEFLKKCLYPKAAGIIAQTQKAHEIYKEMFPKSNYAVIGNPIRNIAISAGNVRENIVVSVGRLIKTKHYDRLIKLFLELDRQDWKLIIVGGDAQGQNNMVKLQAQLAELGNPTNIELAGMQKDVEAYLLKSKIFAFTSSSEGFPNVVGEAMSAGLPVISYDCVAGPSDMIEEGENGYLVPVFDDELFKQRLLELMDDEEKREKMGRRAKDSIRRFEVEKIVDDFYSFITQNKNR